MDLKDGFQKIHKREDPKGRPNFLIKSLRRSCRGSEKTPVVSSPPAGVFLCPPPITTFLEVVPTSLASDAVVGATGPRRSRVFLGGVLRLPTCVPYREPRWQAVATLHSYPGERVAAIAGKPPPPKCSRLQAIHIPDVLAESTSGAARR